MSTTFRRAAVAALALVALSACSGEQNSDPRLGRVVIDEENCLVGDCYEIWKVCQGPDLVIHNSDVDPQDKFVKDSVECEAIK